MSLNNGIKLRTMLPEDYQKVKIFLSDNYFHNGEPISAAAGVDLQRYEEEEYDEFHLSMIKQGTCLTAVDETKGDCIVGVVLAGARCPSELEKLYKKYSNNEPTFVGYFGRLVFTSAWDANVFERFGVSKCLNSYITAVDVTMRGRGLGSRLASALMDLGRAKGFPLMTAYCVSFYSARQKAALGMECVHSVAYKDYKDADGKVIFTPAPPHTHLQIMVCRL